MEHGNQFGYPHKDTAMNTPHAARKTSIRLIVIAFTFMTTAAAQADWLSPAFYGDELDRCAAELRAELDLTGVSRLRHNVTNIDKVGVWYIFDIHTEMVDNTDTVISDVKTSCKAHRWNEQTIVDVTIRLPASNLQFASVD